MVVHVQLNQLSRFIFLFHLYKLFFGLRLERLELVMFQRALRSKRPGKLPRRGSQQMASHLLDHLNDSRVWEVILLLLCHYALLVFVVVSFFPFSSPFVIVFGKSRFFFVVLPEIDYGLN